MKIHEYQAKQILAGFGVPVPKGRVARSPLEARAIAEELGGKVVVKAQIHAGGRGKGGGVKLANSAAEAEQTAGQIIGMQLITHQTGPEGQKVKSVLVEEQMQVARELYLAVLIDSAAGEPVMMVSAAGGMEIEEVAAKTPEQIFRVQIDPATGFKPYMARELAFALGLSGDAQKAVTALMGGLYEAFVTKDASLAEINPLVLTTDGRVLALDAKFNIDDNALFRHKDVAEMRDIDEEDPLEVQAKAHGIDNYIKLDGDIGCIVNGAGLAMATMDTIKLAGGEPANFLDIGTVNDVDRVVNAMQVIVEDPAVKAILINIFGGMARVDVIAQGVIEAYKRIDLKVPVVARLEGTNLEEGERLLNASGLPVIRGKDLGEAAKLAVQAAAGR
ncbi:MAG: ADP-forming succinate--CoA ligase subunit beta [Dehalococcoidia bacterium]